jgi:phage/plasmid-associated DNA primase
VDQLTDDDIDRQVERGEGGDPFTGDPFTEDALALRFSERHADDLRYIALKSQWLQWDGDRWFPEATLLAFDLARDSCRADAVQYGNGKPPARVYSASTIAAVERMAKADRHQATAIEQWDANDQHFNAETATFDLRTGIARPPDPADYITKIAGCAVAPEGTPHPVWTAFLERVAPDPELRAFLKRWCGYCLTGLTSEHKFCFAYGTGANGKSTFINTIREIFGDYTTVADVGTFIASNTERHPTDVAKLHGYRLVVAQETEKGRRWDEAKIKTMTGGDKMAARFMRQDFFDFVPKFKLFIVGNHKPRLDNVRRSHAAAAAACALHGSNPARGARPSASREA